MTTRLLTRALTKAITSPLDKRNAVMGSSGGDLPTPPDGESLLVDDLGNYIIDDLGNYLTAE